MLKHEKQIWLNDWNKKSLFYKLAPPIFAAIYVALFYFSNLLRSDHFFISVLALTLWYAGPRLREVFNFILPLLSVFIVYDTMRFYSDYIRGPIRVTEPYQFDKFFFGINTAEGILTPNEWWQLHTHPLLDLYCGFFYLTFIAIYVLICAYFCFYLPRKGTLKRSAAWIKEQQYTPMWAFFWVNVLGYSTYYWYPAAPPWYVAEHGLGPRQHAMIDAAGSLLYGLLNLRRTLGEEYAELMLVDAGRGRPASVVQRLAALGLETACGTLASLGIIPSEAPIARAIHAASMLSRAAAMWHAASGLPTSLAHRVLNLRHVHYPRRPPVLPSAVIQTLYRLAAGASLVSCALSLLPKRESDSGHGPVRNRVNVQCALCMDAAADPACAECGHVFCWGCIHVWISQRGTCPVCRRPITHAALYTLCNLPANVEARNT